MLYQFGFYSSVLLISFTQELFTALLAKLLKLTINLIIGWVFFLCSLYILWMLGLRVGMTINPIEIFYFTLFSAPLWIGPIIFLHPKFTESLFQIFEKRSTSFNARIAISTIHYCYLDLWPIHFLITISIKRNGQRLWAMVSKTRSTLDDCVFYFKYPILQCIQNSCFK
jgi:hypothetical protein